MDLANECGITDYSQDAVDLGQLAAAHSKSENEIRSRKMCFFDFPKQETFIIPSMLTDEGYIIVDVKNYVTFVATDIDSHIYG